MSGDKADRETVELAALYAAGALGADECAGVEARLASGDEPLRAAIQAFSGAIEALAAAAPEIAPRPQVLERLLDRIASPAEEAANASLARAAHSPPAQLSPPTDTETPPRQTLEQSADLVVIRGQTAQWIPLGEGFQIRTLFVDFAAQRVTLLARMSPGAKYPPHFHQADEECLILEGDLHVGEYVLGPGDYQRAPAGSWHAEQHSAGGCICLVIAPLSAVPLSSV